MNRFAARRPRTAAIFVAALLLAGATQLAGVLSSDRTGDGDPIADAGQPSVTIPDVAIGAPSVPLDRIDDAIGRWAANVGRDDDDYISATNLGSLYTVRARLTGSVDDYARAGHAADLAIAAASSYTPAQVLKAGVLYATHDFGAAADLARSIHAREPGELQALATLGDSELELGHYGVAASTYAALSGQVPGAPVTARLARLAAIQGQLDRARTLAARSVDEARSTGASGSTLAWYRYLAGVIAFQAGDLPTAESQFETALVDSSGWFPLLNGLGRVRAAQGRFSEAIELQQAAIAVVPQPEFLAELGDLYRIVGRDAEAEAQYAVVRAIGRIASLEAQVHNRQLVLFNVNHGEDVPGALALAERELIVRRDVYGYDAVAWALLANGRAAEADVAIRHALSQGTQDAQLYYHAGMIATALGEDDRARTFLTQALHQNPGFDPLQAVRMRETLTSLGG